jgi:hypothetical protein
MPLLRRNRRNAACAALALFGCSPADDTEPFTDCALGDLTGTWSREYTEVRGNCGAVPDERRIEHPDEPADGCDLESSALATDKCQLDMKLACPTRDQLGTQSWSLVLRHVAVDEVKGTGNLAISYPTGTCQSTYEIRITRD